MPDFTTKKAPRARIVPAAVAAAVLAILPVLAAHHLPLLDAPAHESRLAVLRDLLILGHKSRFYDLDTFFLPNVAFDVIGLALSAVASPEVIGRIFFALTLLLTLGGVTVLNRIATGRWSAVPLACVLLLYNLISILGFFSYAFGLALVPWALAARLRLENAPPLLGVVLGAVFGILLLFCHAFDFGIYAAMSAGFALAGWIGGRISFGQAALRALEPVPAAGLFLAMSTGGGSHARYDPHFFTSKLFGLIKSVTSGSMTGDVAFVAGATIFFLLVLLCSRSRLVRSFLPGLIVLALLYLALPAKLASGSYVDSRMPIAIAMLALAGLDMRVRQSFAAKALVALFVVALVVKQAGVAVLWRSFNGPIDAIAEALDALPKGAVILVSECQPENSQIIAVYRERQPSMTHLPAMAAFEDTRFVANSWAIAGQQTVKVAPAYRPYYDLQGRFGDSTCGASDDRAQLARVKTLAKPSAPPLYFFLIRPPQADSLSGEASLVAKDADFELYAVRN